MEKYADGGTGGRKMRPPCVFLRDKVEISKNTPYLSKE